MTISREEIRRVRALAEQVPQINGIDFDDWWRADQLHNRGMHHQDKKYIAALSPKLVIALCDAAERGAEVTADMVVAAVYAYEANSGEISTLHDMRVALEAALAHAGSGKT